MSAVRWDATLIDSPDSQPYAVVGDLVVAVRTPRSRDFVTVEVAPASRYDSDLTHHAGPVLSPRPAPRLADEWQGEVHLGSTVNFRVGGESYRLTLRNISEFPPGFPWITCDLCLERG